MPRCPTNQFKCKSITSQVERFSNRKSKVEHFLRKENFLFARSVTSHGVFFSAVLYNALSFMTLTLHCSFVVSDGTFNNNKVNGKVRKRIEKEKNNQDCFLKLSFISEYLDEMLSKFASHLDTGDDSWIKAVGDFWKKCLDNQR
jgi:hypothetical protein